MTLINIRSEVIEQKLVNLLKLSVSDDHRLVIIAVKLRQVVQKVSALQTAPEEQEGTLILAVQAAVHKALTTEN